MFNFTQKKKSFFEVLQLYFCQISFPQIDIIEPPRKWENYVNYICRSPLGCVQFIIYDV